MTRRRWEAPQISNHEAILIERQMEENRRHCRATKVSLLEYHTRWQDLVFPCLQNCDRCRKLFPKMGKDHCPPPYYKPTTIVRKLHKILQRHNEEVI